MKKRSCASPLSRSVSRNRSISPAKSLNHSRAFSAQSYSSNAPNKVTKATKITKATNSSSISDKDSVYDGLIPESMGLFSKSSSSSSSLPTTETVSASSLSSSITEEHAIPQKKTTTKSKKVKAKAPLEANTDIKANKLHNLVTLPGILPKFEPFNMKNSQKPVPPVSSLRARLLPNTSTKRDVLVDVLKEARYNSELLDKEVDIFIESYKKEINNTNKNDNQSSVNQLTSSSSSSMPSVSSSPSLPFVHTIYDLLTHHKALYSDEKQFEIDGIPIDLIADPHNINYIGDGEISPPKKKRKTTSSTINTDDSENENNNNTDDDNNNNIKNNENNNDDDYIDVAKKEFLEQKTERMIGHLRREWDQTRINALALALRKTIAKQTESSSSSSSSLASLMSDIPFERTVDPSSFIHVNSRGKIVRLQRRTAFRNEPVENLALEQTPIRRSDPKPRTVILPPDHEERQERYRQLIKHVAATQTVVEPEILSSLPDLQYRYYDLRPGGLEAEEILHYFPLGDFGMRYTALSEDEMSILFTRRPRFLNYATPHNPHGLTLPTLQHLSNLPTGERYLQILRRLSHRYWPSRSQTDIITQPKIPQRMNIHRNRNPRSLFRRCTEKQIIPDDYRAITQTTTPKH